MSKPICLGLVFRDRFDYYRGVLRGIRRYLETRPQWLITSISPEPSSLQRSLRMSGRLRPDGLIAQVNTRQLYRILSRWRRPIINVSAVLSGVRFPRVGVDDIRVGQLASDHFLERGLCHFGFVGSPDYLFSTERRAAFGQALRKAGHVLAFYDGHANLKYNPLSQQWDLDPSLQRWLRALPKPAGVFVPNDSLAVQVAEACQRAELHVPDEVSILGVDNDEPHCELTRPPLSSIILPAEQVGYEAATLLDRLLAGDKPLPTAIFLPPIGVATRRSTDVLAIDDSHVIAAVRYIREHAHLPLRVDDVLRHVPVGRRTLERRCRLALGRGLGEEIRRTHLERARRLLAETDLPMKVLASQAGFSSLSYMGLVFRQELGLSPTAYRRQMRSPVRHIGS